MYVCVCNALTDRQLRSRAASAESVAALYRAMAVRPACGKCVPSMRTFLQPSQQQAAARTPLECASKG